MPITSNYIVDHQFRIDLTRVDGKFVFQLRGKEKCVDTKDQMYTIFTEYVHDQKFQSCTFKVCEGKQKEYIRISNPDAIGASLFNKNEVVRKKLQEGLMPVSDEANSEEQEGGYGPMPSKESINRSKSSTKYGPMPVGSGVDRFTEIFNSALIGEVDWKVLMSGAKLQVRLVAREDGSYIIQSDNDTDSRTKSPTIHEPQPKYSVPSHYGPLPTQEVASQLLKVNTATYGSFPKKPDSEPSLEMSSSALPLQVPSQYGPLPGTHEPTQAPKVYTSSYGFLPKNLEPTPVSLLTASMYGPSPEMRETNHQPLPRINTIKDGNFPKEKEITSEDF